MPTKEAPPDRRRLLSALWLFALLNYLYCDLVSLMDADLLRQLLTGRVDDLQISESFLLGASILMEVPIAMILLSRFAGFRVNRTANLAAGMLMTAVQTTTLFLGGPTSYYVFFSIVEILTTLVIVWCAWTWRPVQATGHATTGAVPGPARLSR